MWLWRERTGSTDAGAGPGHAVDAGAVLSERARRIERSEVVGLKPGIEFEGRGLTARISECSAGFSICGSRSTVARRSGPIVLEAATNQRATRPRHARGRRETSDEPTLIDLYRIAFSSRCIAQDARSIASMRPRSGFDCATGLAPATSRLDIGIASDAKPSASDPDNRRLRCRRLRIMRPDRSDSRMPVQSRSSRWPKSRRARRRRSRDAVPRNQQSRRVAPGRRIRCRDAMAR